MLSKRCEAAAKHSRCRRRGGFTMLEIISVVVVIGLLVGLLLPAVQAAREAARQTSCGNNLAQLGLALHAYQNAFKVLPAGTTSEVLPVENYPNADHHNWLVRILPMLDQRALFGQVAWTHSSYDPVNRSVATTELSLVSCPSDYVYFSGNSIQYSSYAGVYDGQLRPLDEESRGLLIANRFLSRDDVPDGLAYTLLAGEKALIDSQETDLGWTSGTRATLRTTGYAPGQEAEQYGDPSEDSYGSEPPPVYQPYGRYKGDAAYDPDAESNSEAAEEDPMADESESWGGYFDEEGDWVETFVYPAPAPPEQRLRPGGFDSRHVGGANMLWGDGRVAIVSGLVDAQTFSQMGIRDDAMPIRPLLED
ncbi:DUF1559 family PulG-like putative transporter [Candidatus Laterigemmans baculatus]|uniref:DUF1559 family PulG-like putative transporter n=1 Tax=Candidatus Laterigemmans baculatus TaxID=2770505 RepID=UPI0013DC1ACC|nr:DUF1559 domain-containing protein [Candidatus Laterigemmans baculatus]